MPIITVDVDTDYPQQLCAGTTLHSASGFVIGIITDSVVSQDAKITSQEISRRTVRDVMFPES